MPDTKAGTKAETDTEASGLTPASDAHYHSAAVDYLSLSAPPALAVALADELVRSDLVTHRANDLLRASGLALLGKDDTRVAKNLKKLKRGETLAPVMLIRGDLRTGRALVVADGYHRICASYHIDEDLDIFCRIADLPAPAQSATPGTGVAKASRSGTVRRTST